MQKYKDLIQKIKDLRTEAKKEAQAALQTGFKDFFAKYPDLESISWMQFTPYFNDGDTCEFCVYSDVELNGEEYWDDPKMPKEAYKEISEFVSMFDEDDMLAVYGDHAKVVILRDGTTEVNDYEHD